MSVPVSAFDSASAGAARRKSPRALSAPGKENRSPRNLRKFRIESATSAKNELRTKLGSQVLLDRALRHPSTQCAGQPGSPTAVSVSPGSADPGAQACGPLATYRPGRNIRCFLQALRNNPGAQLVMTASAYALERSGSPISRRRNGMHPAVCLLLDLRRQMKAGHWPFEYKDPSNWNSDFSLVYLTEFERALERRPDLALPMLVEAIDHVMDAPQAMLDCMERGFTP